MKSPCTAVLRLPGTSNIFHLPSHVPAGQASSSQAQIAPFPNALKAEATWKSRKLFSVSALLLYTLLWQELINSTAEPWGEEQQHLLDSKLSPYCSQTNVTWCLFKWLILDPICKALAFLVSCVCTDWAHLHMQIKCQYEILNIPSTSFSAEATRVNISLHPPVCGEGRALAESANANELCCFQVLKSISSILRQTCWELI